MKRQDITKLHNSKISDLKSKLSSLQKDLVIITQQIKIGKQKNLKLKTNIKRDIARVKTIIWEKTLIQKAQEEKSKKVNKSKTSKNESKMKPKNKKTVQSRKKVTTKKDK